MSPQNYELPGILVNTNPQGGSSSSFSASGQKIVECGPVIRGDKNRPTPWFYRVKDSAYPSGTRKSAIVLSRWSDGRVEWGYYTSSGPSRKQLSAPNTRSLADKAYNKALSKIYEQIRNSNVNAAVTLGEGRETMRMIKAMVSSAVNAKKSIKNLLRGNNVAGASRKLSDAWLGYAYGIRPLVSDVKAFLDFASSSPSVLSVSVKARASSFDRAFWKEGKAEYEDMESHRCQIGCTYVVSDWQLSELSRVTSLFPPTLIWELTTLSFVVDWFFDVGSYLANLEASFGQGLRFQHGYVTESRLCERVERVSWYQAPNPYVWGGQPMSENTVGVWREKALRRDVLTQFPAPRLPTLNIDLGSEQLLSAAALLRTIGLKRL